MPCLLPVLKYCSNRELREKLYRANSTRASAEPYDNTEIIKEVLKLRQEKANLLGLKTYAELSLATKMAPSVEEVEKMHSELRNKCFDIAKQELQTLEEYAKRNGETFPLAHWDIAFWY